MLIEKHKLVYNFELHQIYFSPEMFFEVNSKTESNYIAIHLINILNSPFEYKIEAATSNLLAHCRQIDKKKKTPFPPPLSMGYPSKGLLL